MQISWKTGRKKVAIALFVGLGLLTVACCEMIRYKYTDITPPLIPGAEYVGDETCKTCHCEEHQYFNLSDHAGVTLMMEDENGCKIFAEACETCHGPGSLHVEGGGDTSQILRSDPETCFGCHLNIKGKFSLQYHHPVPEGRMTCSDCHNLHGNDLHANVQAGNQIGLEDKNEICFRCHKSQRGPFAFEHEAMRDGCTTCHNPHGSITDQLLVAGPTTLCLSCHWEQSVNNDRCRIGGSAHDTRGMSPTTSACIDCHTRVHGSNSPSTSLRE